MTAPDRIWVHNVALDEDDAIWWIQPDFLDEHTPYIRKGAFPVEEIKREIDRQSSLTYQGTREVLIRILSLLESDDE